MTVAAFMDLALYDPEFGYYARAARRSGRAGDFFTSVDVGPLFGELLATQVAEMADLVAPDGPFTLVEAGAGDGRLTADLVRGLALRAPSVFARTRPHLVERSNAARAVHGATLADWPRPPFSSSSDLPQDFVGVLVANELLDAMPTHAVVMHEDGLREVFVTTRDGRLVSCEGAVSSPDLAEYLAGSGVHLAPGARAEVSLAAVDWTRRAASALGRGFLVLIDYGQESRCLYSDARSEGTLAAFSRHRAAGCGPDEGWLAEPGSRDITADVNFTAIRQAAEAEGCVTLGLMDQTYFLMALAADRLETLTAAERRAFGTLILPGGLGSTMKVLVLAKGVGAPRLTGCSGPGRLT